MAKLNFWNLMVVKDDFILSGIELILKAKRLFDFKTKIKLLTLPFEIYV